MEISVSSSQRNVEAGQNRRADGPRLEKAPLGDAFSRHLDETRQNEGERNAAAQEAKQRSSQIREDARDSKLREDRLREERQAEARADEKREADRSRESGKKESSPDADKSTEKAAAETAEATGLPSEESETAAKPAEGTGETGENAAKSAEETAGGKETENTETSEAAKIEPQTKAAADAAPADADALQAAAAKAATDGKTSQQTAQTGAIEAAAKGAAPQQAAGQTAQQAQNSQQAQTASQTAAANAAQPQTDASPDAAPSNGSEDGGALPSKEGKTLGQLAAEKLGAKAGGKDDNTEAAKPAAATTDNAPRAATPQQPASALTNLGLAGFGLRGTDQPLNISFDGSDPGALKLDTVNVGSSSQNSNPVMLRFGALPGQAQATQVPTTAIAMQIARHVQKGVNTFEIRIDPPELGRVDVKLEMTDGRVNAHLVVEKPETLDLLQRDSRALQQALRDAGLDVNEDTLNFSLSDENGAESFAEQERGSSQGSAGKDTASQAEQDTLVTAQYHLSYAGDGGVDIRV